MVAQIADLIRPTQDEIEDMATRETSLEGTGEFRPIAAGPLAAVALMAFIGMAAVPLSLWRIVRAGLRTGRS